MDKKLSGCVDVMGDVWQVHSDFVVAATRGAMAVIDGNIMAINPGEDSK